LVDTLQRLSLCAGRPHLNSAALDSWSGKRALRLGRWLSWHAWALRAGCLSLRRGSGGRRGLLRSRAPGSRQSALRRGRRSPRQGLTGCSRWGTLRAPLLRCRRLTGSRRLSGRTGRRLLLGRSRGLRGSRRRLRRGGLSRRCGWRLRRWLGLFCRGLRRGRLALLGRRRRLRRRLNLLRRRSRLRGGLGLLRRRGRWRGWLDLLGGRSWWRLNLLCGRLDLFCRRRRLCRGSSRRELFCRGSGLRRGLRLLCGGRSRLRRDSWWLNLFWRRSRRFRPRSGRLALLRRATPGLTRSSFRTAALGRAIGFLSRLLLLR
jgi:hypothetical protein